MRIGVIGTGAVGGTIAALLDRAGCQVEVTARGEHLAAIRERGLTLAGAWGDHVARPHAGETLSRQPEIAFICTKAQDAPEAIRANHDLLGGIPVVIAQNGLVGVDEASRLLPDSECIGLLALYAAQFLAPGTITVTASGPSYVGVGGGAVTESVRHVARTLNTAMPTVATDNFVGTQWTKLIVNQVNAMPAITGMSAQETIADRRLRRLITLSMREAARVGFASGVTFGTLKPLDNGLLRVFAAVPVWVGQALPWLMARRMGTVPNQGSTLQSIRRGRSTEIDYLNGAVVDAAEAAGVPAPVNAAFVALVHRVERDGRFLTPAEVLAAVPGASHRE